MEDIYKLLNHPRNKKLKEIYNRNIVEISCMMNNLYQCAFRFNLLNTQIEYLLNEALKPFLDIIFNDYSSSNRYDQIKKDKEKHELEIISNYIKNNEVNMENDKKNLNDLNQILFNQLEKVTKENDSVSLGTEINKSYAVAQLGQTVVNSYNTILKGVKLAKENHDPNDSTLKYLGFTDEK